MKKLIVFLMAMVMFTVSAVYALDIESNDSSLKWLCYEEDRNEVLEAMANGVIVTDGIYYNKTIYDRYTPENCISVNIRSIGYNGPVNLFTTAFMEDYLEKYYNEDEFMKELNVNVKIRYAGRTYMNQEELYRIELRFDGQKYSAQENLDYYVNRIVAYCTII